ncbi:hypothetical protein NIES3974_29370 [Calothrix sp. NIES-3974]|nr:hypothetical protein NIES3974_29370 [Calothrix sp. NIES-3974]
MRHALSQSGQSVVNAGDDAFPRICQRAVEVKQDVHLEVRCRLTIILLIPFPSQDLALYLTCNLGYFAKSIRI